MKAALAAASPVIDVITLQRDAAVAPATAPHEAVAFPERRTRRSGGLVGDSAAASGVFSWSSVLSVR